MSHGEIIEDEEDQHSDEVLKSFEEESRVLEKWIEDPKVYTKVVECKEAFQIKRRLKGSLLEEKNVDIGKQVSQEEGKL